MINSNFIKYGKTTCSKRAGHDIATRHLVLGHGMIVIPQILRSNRAVRPQYSG